MISLSSVITGSMPKEAEEILPSGLTPYIAIPARTASSPLHDQQNRRPVLE